MAVCDNTNVCAAYGPAESNLGYLLIRMAPGPSAKPEVHMGNCCLSEAGDSLRYIIDDGTYRGVQKDRSDVGSHLSVSMPPTN